MQHIFLVTHLGSGASLLTNMFHAHRRFVVIPPRPPFYVYEDPTYVDALVEMYKGMKLDATTFVHRIDFSQSLSKSVLACNHWKYIYLVREPRETINYLITQRRYRERTAYHYYIYRLRRLAETARLTPGALFLSWEDVVSRRAAPLLVDYLKVRELSFPFREEAQPDVAHEGTVEDAMRTYNRVMRYVNSLPLKRTTKDRQASAAS